MKLINAFRAGATGQPVPGEADHFDGKAIAISSAIAGATGILGFGLGRLVYKAKQAKAEKPKK